MSDETSRQSLNSSTPERAAEERVGRETTMPPEESNVSKTKGVGETLMPAIIGLVGVLVGSFISTGSNYLLAIRTEEVEQAKRERVRDAEIRTAARLVSDQLARVGGGATILFEQNDLPAKAFDFPLDAWDKNKAILAREMDFESFNQLTQALFRAEAFRMYRDAALSEPKRNRSEDGKSFFNDIKRGVDALRPYMDGLRAGRVLRAMD